MAEEEGYESYSDSSAGDVAKTTAEDLPGVGSLVKAGVDASKGEIGSVGSDIASFASGAMSIAEDPLQALISAGLGFLMDVITPLKTALEQVTGNPEALDKASESFTDIGKDVANLANELTDITTQGFANWTGDAKNAAAKQTNDFISQVDQTADIAGNISMCLQLSSTLMDAAYNFVLGIISQCIEWLIVTWIAAQAAAIPTLGASEVAATAATTGEVAVEGANAADKVEEATTMVEKIVKIIKDLWSKLKNMLKYMKDMKDAEKAEKAAKDAETAAKDGTKVASDADKAATDADKAASDATKAESDASKAGGDAGKADGDAGKSNGDGGSGGGDKPSDDSSDTSTSSDNRNALQKKWDETKENWNDKVHPTVNQSTGRVDGTSSFGDYMKDKLGEAGTDAGKDVLIGSAGDAANRIQYGAETAPSAPEQDGTEQEDPSMSGSLYD